MSFNGHRVLIEEGDDVILHLGKESMLTTRVQKGESFQTKYGCLRHNDVIGKHYGCKVKCPKGYLHVLQPTPELWTQNLPHRTQILYSTDISLISIQLDMKPGSIIVESGTGSASLSHAIIRSIAPGGHLYTYEFHEHRAKTAQEEFLRHGLAQHVTVTHRDVCADGFTIVDKADAVFLDLPNPQDALEHAKRTLKPTGGRLCSFSPCIEQVQKTCAKLSDLGFVEIQTLECLQRQLEVKTLTMTIPDMGDTQHDLKSGLDLPGILHDKDGAVSFKSALYPITTPGHTGFLTFCTLYAKD